MLRLPHVCGLCLLLRVWQLLALAPFRFSREIGARCHRYLTLSAAIRLLLLTSVAPLLLHQSSALYDATNVRHSVVFRRIALGTMAGDVIISLALLGTHLWNRRKLADLMNGLAKLHRHQRLSWTYTILLWLKLLLSLYEVLCNVPFLQRTGGRLPWPQLLAYGIQLYVQHVSSVYANGIFGGMLLFLSGLDHLQRKQTGLRQLLQEERRYLCLAQQFIGLSEGGIFLLVVGNFINILANMYAYMTYFVQQHGVPLTISNYCLIVTLQLYALVLAAHLCQVRHSRLRAHCLEVGYVPEGLTREQVGTGKWLPKLAAEEVSLQAKTATPFPLISPTGSLKFGVLGLFTLDNSFWLFLLSYAMNFIVIILQFTLENMKRTRV
ncbi:hypothetical protein KR018_001227 [Drosophila ironensis]|nr:hypothetical protein KR018_001227 [Drosophila ironensis]